MADISFTGRPKVGSPALNQPSTNEPTSRRQVQLRPLPALYGTLDLIMDKRRLQSAWRRYRKSRRRRAIYEFLAEILEVVTIWRADGHAKGRTRRMMYRRGFKTTPEVIEPFRDLIVAISHREKLDRRTVAKWARVLRYADEYKSPGKPLDRFVMRRGGINGCAALYTRRLGRNSKRKAKSQHFGLS